MNRDPSTPGGNIARDPDPRFKLDSYQMSDIQGLDDFAHSLRNRGETDEAIEVQIRDAYERSKAKTKMLADGGLPAEGYEIAVAGIVVGSVPRTLTARRAMEGLVDRGLVDPHDMGWFDGFASTIRHVAAPAADHLGVSQQSLHLADSLREAEVYLAAAEAAGRQTDGLRLLLLMTAYGASQDYRFRNSSAFEGIGAYQHHDYDA